MKNFLILGLLALLLFSVSAALSLWLNQSKQPTDGDKVADKDKEKDKSKNPSRAPEHKEPADTRPPAKADTPPTDPQTLAVLRDRESRLDRRAAQMELVVRDLQAQREAVDALVRQVALELKTAAGKAGDLEALAADLDRKKIDLAAAERKNIEKMAAMYDSMAPESAALILKQMADSGRMDTAVKILAQMKDRQAARVLAELADPALAAQLLDKMRGLKAAGPAPTPIPTPPPPGGAVAPARGP